MNIELQTVLDIIEANINEHKRIRASVTHYNPDAILALEIMLHDIKEATFTAQPDPAPSATDSGHDGYEWRETGPQGRNWYRKDAPR